MSQPQIDFVQSVIWCVFLIKTCFCFWLEWLFSPESPLRADSSIWLEVRSLAGEASGLQLVMAVSVSGRLAECFSDRGRAVSNAIIPIILNLWSHQSLWQPFRPPVSVPVCKASFDKLFSEPGLYLMFLFVFFLKTSWNALLNAGEKKA